MIISKNSLGSWMLKTINLEKSLKSWMLKTIISKNSLGSRMLETIISRSCAIYFCKMLKPQA
jgi:hypothetical protein